MRKQKSKDLTTIIIMAVACALSGLFVFLLITKVVAPTLGDPSKSVTDEKKNR